MDTLLDSGHPMTLVAQGAFSIYDRQVLIDVGGCDGRIKSA